MEFLGEFSVGREGESSDELVQNWLVVLLEQVLDGFLLADEGILLLGLLVAAQLVRKRGVLWTLGISFVPDGQGIFVDFEQPADG